MNKQIPPYPSPKYHLNPPYHYHPGQTHHLFCLAAAAKSLQSCPTLCDPIDGSPPGSPVPGILQAMTSWQIDGETMETVTDFIFLGSKITADGDCSHEIKRRLLLGRKAMTNLDILESRHITLPTKVHIVKATVFPVQM